jgi:hypothetical protein
MKTSSVFSASVLAAVLCIASSASAMLSGGGTQANPYLIQSRADFDEFANPANSPTYWASGKYTKLMCDLDLSGTTYTQAVIGEYYGIIEGNGHKISGLTITAAPTQDSVGLFGYVGSGGQIKSLGLESVNVSGGRYDVGGLVGYNGAGTLTGCYVAGLVSGTSDVGGLVGYSPGTITACYSTASVSGTHEVGGLVGYNQGTLTACYSNGSVTGTNHDVGGLMGWCFAGTVTSCYSTGSVSGGSYVGGLTGGNSYSALTSCYATGSVTGGIPYAGGLVGYRLNDTIIGCFWNTQTCLPATAGVGNGDSTGVTGRLISEMKTLSTFTAAPASWDFTNETTNGTNDYWRMCGTGVDYPRLNGQSTKGDLLCPNGVSFTDLGALVQRWLSDTCDLSNNFCGGTDIDYSGAVNMTDYAMMMQHWLAGV